MTTNYTKTFIAVSPDSTARRGERPTKAGSIAALQHELLREQPYAYTSDDLLFEVHVRRNNVPDDARTQEREAFFAKSHACLRASPLVKQYGWGLHADQNGRVAAYGVETDEYRRFTAQPDIRVVAGLRSRRA